MQRTRNSFSRLLLGLLSALCLLAAAYSLIGRGLSLFQDARAFAIYLAGPVLLGAFFWLARHWSDEVRDTLTIAVVSAVASLYMAEIYLEFFDKKPVTFAALRDTRLGFEVVLDLRKQGVDAYPNLTFRGEVIVPDSDDIVRASSLSGTDLIPLAQISRKHIVFCNEDGDWRSFDSDERGFNNPPGLWSSGNIDIAAIGDSFVVGYCVPPEEHTIGIVRKRYPRTLNVGRNGTGPLVQLALIREYLPDVRPKVVLWFFIEDNDIYGDMRDELFIPSMRRYLEPGFRQGLMTRQDEIDRALMARTEELLEARRNQPPDPPSAPQPVLTRARVTSIAKLTHLRGVMALGVDPAFEAESRDLLARYEDILRSGREVVAGWEGRVILVYQPSIQRFRSWRFARSARAHQAEIEAAAARAGVPVISLVADFEGQPSPMSLYQGVQHYTSEGYGLVGAGVVAGLERWNVLPAR